MTAGDDMAPGREILVRLLDATPLPTPGSGVEQMLEAIEGIMAERSAILALIVPPLRIDELDRPLLVELEQREAVWNDALATAQRAIGEQRCGAAHLRAYAPTI